MIKKVVCLRGFTLVELLVVISILAILSAVGIAVFSGSQSSARDGARRSDVQAIAKALEQKYDPDTNSYITVATSDFTSGSFPKPPRDGDYQIFYGTGNQSWSVCSRLDVVSSNYCSPSTSGATQCFCIKSAQGGTTSVDPATASSISAAVTIDRNGNSTNQTVSSVTSSVITLTSGSTPTPTLSNNVSTPTPTMTTSTPTPTVAQATPTPTTASNTLQNGLISYWMMDEAAWPANTISVIDIKSGNNGGPMNGVNTDGSSSRYGRSGAFNVQGNAGQYISIASGNNLPTGNASRTVCAWAKTITLGSSQGGSPRAWIFAYGDLQTGNYFGIRRDGGALVGSLGGSMEIGYTSSWNTSDWYNVCLSFDSGTAKLYGNGALKNTRQQVTLNTSNNARTIGVMMPISINYSPPPEYWNGWIDEVRVYNRALSDIEVSQLYQATTPP